MTCGTEPRARSFTPPGTLGLHAGDGGCHVKAVQLYGKPDAERDDSHIQGPGAVGFRTKADSVTAIDDSSHGAKRA